MFRFLISAIFLLSISGQAKTIKTEEFNHDNLSFNYLASDGGFWFDCKHVKGKQPHGWTVYCDRYVFKLHLMLNQYQKENETTFEFHYWADEFENLNETHTQSTWLTVDKNVNPKEIIGYLGFTKDSTQLRLKIKPELKK
jgi:hypothetical protein